MLGSFSALIDRPFVVGYVIPVIIFLSVMSVMFPGHIPISQAAGALASGESNVTGVVFTLLLLWISALFLSLINTPIYRFLEGYYWPISHFRWLKLRQQRRRTSLVNKYKSLRRQLIEPEEITPEIIFRPIDSDVKSAIYEQAQDILAALKREFPGKQHPLLPMRIGNVIRAFERYPNDIYGADGVHIWPLVNAVMPDESRKDVANSKADTDFFVNIAVLASTATLIFLCVSIDIAWSTLQFCSEFGKCGFNQWLPTLTKSMFVMSSLAITWTSYLAAIVKAASWGVEVRTAFDLNLDKVASQLGLTVPRSSLKKKAMWQAIAMRSLYHEPIPDRYYRSPAQVKKP